MEADKSAVDTVLIIERDWIVASALAEEFETSDWRIIGPYASLEQAVAAAPSKAQVAIVDLALSEARGLHGSSESLKSLGDLVVLTSQVGLSGPEIVHICKPYDLKELSEKVFRYSSRRSRACLGF